MAANFALYLKQKNMKSHIPTKQIALTLRLAWLLLPLLLLLLGRHSATEQREDNCQVHCGT
jgi:hypothetical protein